MKNSISRREALLGTGALSLSTGIVASCVPAVAMADPLEILIAEHIALWPLCPEEEDETGCIRWNNEINRLEAEISETLPTTQAGALAAVRFIGLQLSRFAGEGWMFRTLTMSADILAREV